MSLGEGKGSRERSARALGSRVKASPQKLGLVADLIRGRPAGDALNLLKFCRKRVAPVVAKVLQSAIANAENNHAMDVDLLSVAAVWVGKDRALKRWHARARGRGSRILKHYSKIVVVVQEEA